MADAVWPRARRLRYLLAWDHDLCRAVAARLVRAVFRDVLGERARDEGIEGVRGGAVVGFSASAAR